MVTSEVIGDEFSEELIYNNISSKHVFWFEAQPLEQAAYTDCSYSYGRERYAHRSAHLLIQKIALSANS